ncbi:MAG TPA: trypsin-like serine protease [Solirubrobacteraceae bacterium]|nr:trypsin-like serine protease [Solirubrobacteraceae bacterium]
MLAAVLLLAAAASASRPRSHAAGTVWSGARAHALAAYRRGRALRAQSARRHARRRRGAREAIVGGSQTSADQFPWQVAVLTETGLCGGVVVGLGEVLTAGHCVVDPETGEPLLPAEVLVLAGSSNLSEEESVDPAVQERIASAVRVHPYFDYAAGPGTPDDVAVIDVGQALLETATVKSVKALATVLPPAEGMPALVSGFGEQDTEPAELDGNLYALSTTIGFSRECGLEERANALFVCASTPSGTICRGDSGGALVSGSPASLIGVVDTVRIVGGRTCVDGAVDGFANVTAPEILDFVEGSEAPPVAPRGGGAGIRGFIEVGKSLTCEPGSWSGSPTYTYAFIDSAGQVLQQGPATSYPLTSADLGRAILCEVYATNAGGTGVGRTPALPPIEAARTGAAAGTPPGSGGGAAPVQAAAVSSPPSGAGIPGPGIGVSQIAALLKKALAPAGKLAKIASLLGSGRTTVTFAAPQAGSVSISWYLAGARASSARDQASKPLLVASGHKAFAKAGSARIAIALTSAGKRALRGRKHATLTAKGTFTRAGASAVTAAKTFVLAG